MSANVPKPKAPRDAGTDPANAAATLDLLVALEEHPDATQRSLATRMGIALGLTNAYVHRAIRKGWVKVRTVPARRYLYYLTPTGFAEKAKLTREYLSDSLQFFRRARGQLAEIFERIEASNGRSVALVGAGDFAEIACLSALGSSVKVIAIIDPEVNVACIAGVPVVRSLAGLQPVDALIITDVHNPQALFDALSAIIPADRLHAPAVLRIRVDGARQSEFPE